MLKTIGALIEALYQGKQLGNAQVWKNSAAGTSVLAAFLVSAATVGKQFGVDLGLGEKDWFSIAGAVFLVFQGYTHWATSKTVGLKANAAVAE